MSHLSNALQLALDDCGWSQTEAAKLSGVAGAQINRYCNDSTPSVEVFNKLVRIFPEDHQAKLIKAFLLDLPVELLHLVRVEIKDSTLQEPPPDGLADLPEPIRKNVRYIISQCHKTPVADMLDVMRRIISGEL